MDYFFRVQRAIDYIDNNLTEEISPEGVAQVAGFSLFHFHRIFLAVAGDSITEYIRKRRLTEAAQTLSDSDKRIIDIAFEYQYQSQEAFTRAFKKMFGTTPGRYREKQVRSPYFLYKKKITEEILLHLQRGISMDPKIIMKDEFTVIGLEYVGPNQNNEIGQLWDVFNRQMVDIKHLKSEHQAYGVCSPAPEGAEEGNFCYVAGMEVTGVSDVPQGMVVKVVPAGKYVVFTHKGLLEKLRSTYEYIYGTWLPKSGFEVACQPDFEYYDERFKPGSLESEFDIYVPIK